MAGKTVWVSGASSGLGKAAAKALLAKGWQVVSGARSFLGDEPLGDLGKTLPLDVRSQESVDAFCEKALLAYGVPDALVNAAGILIMGPAEDLALSEYQAVMDTIFFGTVRLTQAVLPLMRKNGRGKIVMLSSVNGLMPTPFQSAYVAAKHGLEGFSECLLLETKAHGVQVMLVEPGDHAGGAQEYRRQAAEVPPRFRESLQRVRNVIARDEGSGLSPGRLGFKVARALDKNTLPMRLRVAPFSQRAAVVLHDILPNRLFLYLISKYYGV